MAKLTYAQRKALPKSAFCIPEVDGYPVHDPSHGANALTRAKTYLKKNPAEAKRIYDCVCSRYRGQVPACSLGFEAWWRKRRGR